MAYADRKDEGNRCPCPTGTAPSSVDIKEKNHVRATIQINNGWIGHHPLNLNRRSRGVDHYASQGHAGGYVRLGGRGSIPGIGIYTVPFSPGKIMPKI